MWESRMDAANAYVNEHAEEQGYVHEDDLIEYIIEHKNEYLPKLLKQIHCFIHAPYHENVHEVKCILQLNRDGSVDARIPF